MKYHYFLYFLLLFKIFNSIELGGIKFAISERMANDVLYHLYPEIVRELHSINLGNIEKEDGSIGAQKVTMGISNLSLDKFKLKFNENGINIKIAGLKAGQRALLILI